MKHDLADNILPTDSSCLEIRLEKGDLIYPSWSLDSFFNSDELQSLCSHKPKGLWNQTISFEARNGRLTGANSKELESLLGRISRLLTDKIQIKGLFKIPTTIFTITMKRSSFPSVINFVY